ncbi:DUF3887 domain-containing protein [Evansella cellulosilytica]|uniref:DUF3887 domain-containing protein n=1 Tax=Evansella cellulosilytica (strain ATCC 21833 / DSM 2522 / FERM P-1141 / JCM 9156 / N-4) TaxID=649639 RepID=E6TY43_EVAC2|nr:DUF3887 domain-containing protein [Evansella cellulosilytica]ADU32362.1 hypothetical protein Bcell_4135 [Evansella cellulosilytica DSM 2522]
MRKQLLVFLLLLTSMIVTIGCNDHDDIEEIAVEYLEQLKAENFDEASAMFNDRVQALYTTEQLEKTWEEIKGDIGEFKGQEYEATEEFGTSETVHIRGIFDKNQIIFSFNFDENNKITNFYIH